MSILQYFREYLRTIGLNSNTIFSMKTDFQCFQEFCRLIDYRLNIISPDEPNSLYFPGFLQSVDLSIMPAFLVGIIRQCFQEYFRLIPHSQDQMKLIFHFSNFESLIRVVQVFHHHFYPFLQ